LTSLQAAKVSIWTGIEQISGSLGSGDDTVIAGAQTLSVNGGLGTDYLKVDYSSGLSGGDVLNSIRFVLGEDGRGSFGRAWEILNITGADGSSRNSTIYLDNFEQFDVTGFTKCG